jgi:Putative zinc-finger
MTDRVDGCTEPQSPSLHLAVGAYALGALGLAEADQISTHLARCPSCHEEYLDLLDLVPLLATVAEADAVHGPLRPGPDPLDQTLAAWRRDTARSQTTAAEPDRRLLPRSGRTRYALAAACLALLAAVSVIATQPSTAGQPTVQPAQPAWSASATATPNPADPDTDGATASVQVSTATWGSAIELTVEHTPQGYECTMIVVATDGHHETAGTWKTPASGTITIPGTVGIEPGQIAAIQVLLPDGTILVTLHPGRNPVGARQTPHHEEPSPPARNQQPPTARPRSLTHNTPRPPAPGPGPGRQLFGHGPPTLTRNDRRTSTGRDSGRDQPSCASGLSTPVAADPRKRPMAASRDSGPGPMIATIRKPQQNSAANSPPFSIGNSPWNTCTVKYA